MSLPPINIYERESTELLRVAIRKDKNLINTGVFLAIIPLKERPIETDWVIATPLNDGKCGILIDNLAVGTYAVWGRVVTSPEDIIWTIGAIKII